jgi:hypothetical protein
MRQFILYGLHINNLEVSQKMKNGVIISRQPGHSRFVILCNRFLSCCVDQCGPDGMNEILVETIGFLSYAAGEYRFTHGRLPLGLDVDPSSRNPSFAPGAGMVAAKREDPAGRGATRREDAGLEGEGGKGPGAGGLSGETVEEGYLRGLSNRVTANRWPRPRHCHTIGVHAARTRPAIFLDGF